MHGPAQEDRGVMRRFLPTTEPAANQFICGIASLWITLAVRKSGRPPAPACQTPLP
jgi:hypothetical protein